MDRRWSFMSLFIDCCFHFLLLAVPPVGILLVSVCPYSAKVGLEGLPCLIILMLGYCATHSLSTLNESHVSTQYQHQLSLNIIANCHQYAVSMMQRV
jgi:hypothetical protein